MVSAGLAIAARLLQAVPVGRFQRAELPQPAGFHLDREGFSVRGVPGPRFRFPARLSVPSLAEASPTIGIVTLVPQTGGPASVEVNLAAPGFLMDHPRGFALALDPTSSPLLTVAEVSVDSSHPTPPSNWVLVSFAEPEVPVLFVFERPVMSVLRKQGEGWLLTTEAPYRGSVMVRLPIGAMRLTNHVADLGAASALVQEQKTVWLGAPPRFLESEFAAVEGGVRVTWKYDRPGAIVPPFMLLQDPASGVKLESPYTTTLADLDSGPQAFAKQNELKAFFPARWLLSSQPLGVSSKVQPVRAYRPPGIPPRLEPDYLSGTLGQADQTEAVKAGAAALNPILYSSDPRELGLGALLHAGLAAVPALAALRAERGLESAEVPFADPTKAFRDCVFGAPGTTLEGFLRSPVRVSGNGDLTCVEAGDQYQLSWRPSSAKAALTLASPWPLDVTDAKGVGSIQPKPGKEWFTLRVEPTGQLAELKVKLPPRVRLPSVP